MGYPGGPPPGYVPYPPPLADVGGPSAVVIAIVALVLLAVVGVGAMVVLKLGPFAPAATPTPTMVAGEPTPTHGQASTPIERPTSEVSAPPTAGLTEAPHSPALTLPPPTGPVDVGAQLLTHVPDDIRDTCLATAGTPPVLALATCAADGDQISVTYFQYPDPVSMEQAYDLNVAQAEIERDTGSCIDVADDGEVVATVESWPAENSYTIGDEVSGRWLCTDSAGVPTVYWTDMRLNILSQATHAGSDYDRLVDFWVNESGPYE